MTRSSHRLPKRNPTIHERLQEDPDPPNEVHMSPQEIQRAISRLKALEHRRKHQES